MLDALLRLDLPLHILVVDDNSPDGTQDIVRTYSKKYPEQIQLLARPAKQGLGRAYIEGFQFALKNNYQYILQMDSDFSHNPMDVPKLIQACKAGADLSIGSRYIKGGGVVNWPFSRVLLSRLASLYVRMVLWMPLMDPTAGFVCYRRKVLEQINLDQIKFIGYAFQIEMKYASWSIGCSIREVPIIFQDRIEGYSKMSRGIIKEAITGVIALRWFRLWNSYKVIGPK